MRRVRFLFYVSGPYDKPLSRIIGSIGWMANRRGILKYFGQKTLVSHQEIEFCDRYSCCESGSLIKLTPDCIKGTCFSSARRGKFWGVRFDWSKRVLAHPDRWLYIEVELPDEVEQAMFDAARSIEGEPYDGWGFFWKLLLKQGQIQNKKAWYCSEACNWAANQAYYYWNRSDLRMTGFAGFGDFVECFSKHRRWSPAANLILMLDAGYKCCVAPQVNK